MAFEPQNYIAQNPGAKQIGFQADFFFVGSNPIGRTLEVGTALDSSSFSGGRRRMSPTDLKN